MTTRSRRASPKQKTTSRRVASKAGAARRSSRASKGVKSIAGSALAQRKKKPAARGSALRSFKAGKDL